MCLFAVGLGVRIVGSVKWGSGNGGGLGSRWMEFTALCVSGLHWLVYFYQGDVLV